MPPPPESVDVEVQLSNLDDVEAARSAVWAWSLEHGFSEQAAYDVIIATSEVVTNGLVHGSPPVRLRGWRHGDTLVVQVDDAGGRPIPSAAGYRRPDDPAPRGRGLWLARQLAAVVATHTTTGRTSVRLFFPRAVTHGSSTSPQ
jgi:anti-sigma regulatory factor (Ser/Thr protein kinase)